MNSLFEKQVYVRLSEDGTSFIYTVKYGRFATATREMRLAGACNKKVLVAVAPPPPHAPAVNLQTD